MSQDRDYDDLEICIHKREAKGYPIELTVNSSQVFQGGHLKVDFLPWIAGSSVAEDGFLYQ